MPLNSCAIASRASLTLGVASLAALLMHAPAQAVPTLSFSSAASAYGYLNTQYDSPLLGSVSFTLNGPADYKYNQSGLGSNTTGVASADFTVATGSGGLDPVYDIVTSAGQYGFSYKSRAETAGLRLRTAVDVHTFDADLQLSQAQNTTASAYAYANWNQQFYIGPTATRPAGSYGAILVGYTLDGSFAPSSGITASGSASAYGQIGTSFTDTGGANFQSTFYLSASTFGTWNGSATAFHKLLFQYGTPFNINLYQYVSAYVNGSADFFNTGYISSVELPFGATLASGAEQAGLGSVSQLYGTVTQSATADAVNTNWDFANNGGVFVPPNPVPEPATGALMVGGLMGVLLLARRRTAAAQRR